MEWKAVSDFLRLKTPLVQSAAPVPRYAVFRLNGSRSKMCVRLFTFCTYLLCVTAPDHRHFECLIFRAMLNLFRCRRFKRSLTEILASFERPCLVSPLWLIASIEIIVRLFSRGNCGVRRLEQTILHRYCRRNYCIIIKALCVFLAIQAASSLIRCSSMPVF